jgi:hypothetical protein
LASRAVKRVGLAQQENQYDRADQGNNDRAEYPAADERNDDAIDAVANHFQAVPGADRPDAV